MSDDMLCGYVCMGARRCGIVLHEQVIDGMFVFQWYDNKLIKGDAHKDRKQALKSACMALTDYFCQ